MVLLLLIQNSARRPFRSQLTSIMKFATKAIHAGYDPDPVTGAVMPPYTKHLPTLNGYPENIRGTNTPECKTLREPICKMPWHNWRKEPQRIVIQAGWRPLMLS